MSAMSQAQADALNKAKDSLGELFDNVLIVVNHREDNGQFCETRARFSGGFIGALGLAQWACTRLVTNKDDDERNPDQEPDGTEEP